ncbi:MAG TPA: hypothetical protein VF538_04630 [Pyrinomonadaceae bacterium]|jgi:hypothetical protein
MPVKESSATALVRITGLAISCFNKTQRRGELAVIRDENHSLSIKLRQPSYQDGSGGDTVAYRDVVSYSQLPKEDVRIEIKALGKSAVEGYEIYQSGDFDRLTSEDLQDYGWIVNVNDLHGGTPLTPTADGPYPLAKLYIEGGQFYTAKLDTHLLFEKVEKDAGGAETRRELFGNVAETIGVKIESEEVSFTIRVGDREETHLLKRVEGLPSLIVIDNIDHDATAIYSDMPDYYKYLSSPDGNKFDLVPVVEAAGAGVARGGAVNQEQFCHPIGTDLDSIDDL